MPPEPVPVELPRFQVPGTTETFDLLDRLPNPVLQHPLWQLFETFIGPLRRYGFNAAVRRQVNDLAPMLAERLGTARVGYLLRLNAYADEYGNLHFPGGEVVSAYGVGLEPLDAMAESYRKGAIRNERPSGLRDESHYCWMVREGTRLTCTHIPPELARDLESRAGVEAQRRDLLGGFIRDSEGALEQTQAAQYWSEVITARELELENLGIRQEIEALADRMKAEQDAFNLAYAGFQRITRDMADNAREERFLQSVGVVLNVVGAGIRLRDGPSTPSHRNKAPMTQENMVQWRATRTRTFGELREQITIEVNTRADNLDRIQTEIRTEMETRGIPVPQKVRIPREQ